MGDANELRDMIDLAFLRLGVAQVVQVGPEPADPNDAARRCAATIWSSFRFLYPSASAATLALER